MNPGPATSIPVIVGIASSFGTDQLGQRARIGARALGQHHRGIGREVAVAGVARRLDRDVLAVEAGGQRALGGQFVEDAVEQGRILRVERRAYKDGEPLAQQARRVTRQKRSAGSFDRSDQLLVAGDGEAVGHAGDEVADAAQAVGFVAFPCPALGEQSGVVAIGGGEVGDDAMRFFAHGVELGGAVELA